MVGDLGFVISSVSKTVAPGLRIGFVGTLVWHKGAHVLVEAVRRLDPQGYELLLCGSLDTFPDYTAVLPKGNDKLVTVDRDVLAQAIRRVSITADRITSQIKLGIESGRMEMSARGTEGSQSEDEISVSYDGDALEIGFNFTYLQDILKNIRSDSIQLSLKDSQSAALITPLTEDGEETGVLCLLMPLRLAGD